MADLRPAPTPTAMLIGTAIIAVLSGYMLGIASSLGFLPIPFMPRASAASAHKTVHYDSSEESESEEISDGAILDHAPNWANGYEADKRDGLRAGLAEAAAAEEKAKRKQGQAKVALQVKSEEELQMLQATAISLGLVAEVVQDAGRTQIASGSRTVLGIGPAPKSVVDKGTGSLKRL